VKTLLVVSFGTVVALVTGVCFLAVVLGAAAGDRQSVVAGVTLWSMMALVVLVTWLVGKGVTAVAGRGRRGR
jgi:hypothetical protein